MAQEWLIHAYLFHGAVDWFGRRIHEAHHRAPYHHIALDGPEIAVPVILLATAMFWAALGPALGVCAALGYVGQGLFYQFTHYVVHTRAVPRARFWRRVRQHHLQHHCRCAPALHLRRWRNASACRRHSVRGVCTCVGASLATPGATRAVLRTPATSPDSGPLCCDLWHF